MKGFRLVRDMPECKTELSKKKKKKKILETFLLVVDFSNATLFHRKKAKKNKKNPKI